jgi:hypothetical protein
MNYDAGHTHGPTAHFVTGCPLCDAAKTARNQAIGHLHEALRLMATINPSGVQPTIRLNLGPIGITGDDIPHCHSIDLTAKHAEALSDAVDSMNAYAGSQPAQDATWPGEWSAAAISQNNPDLWDEVNDAFFEFDLRAITKDVLDETELDNLTVNRALDSWFGDIPDPELTALYADDDEGGE